MPSDFIAERHLNNLPVRKDCVVQKHGDCNSSPIYLADSARVKQIIGCMLGASRLTYVILSKPSDFLAGAGGFLLDSI